MGFELEKMNIEHRTSNIEHRMGNQRTEDRKGQKSEVGGRMSEGQEEETGDRGREGTEVRCQRSEIREQKTKKRDRGFKVCALGKGVGLAEC